MPNYTNVKNIHERFERYNDADNPGLAVMAIKNGEILFKKGYGLSHLETKEKIGADTNFRMASVTKPFTAMGIAILEAEGKIRTDDHVNRYFHDFPAYGKEITIGHLVHHLSGLPDYCMALCSTNKGIKPLTSAHLPR